METTQEDMLSK